MGIVCMLFPALVFCNVRHRVNGKKIEKSFESIIHCIMEFACGSVWINVLVIGIRILLRQKSGNIFYELNQYSDFAVKYLLLGLFFAVLLPYVERYFRNEITIGFKVNLGGQIVSVKNKKILVVLFAILMAAHHFIRMFDNSFWGDEGIAILAARMSWADMLKRVAECGHSPFHYAFVWFCCRIFGHSGMVYHFASTLPYFITVIITLTLVWKLFGTEVVLILTALDTLLRCAVTYNLEVRMYAWCQLFIFLTYLMAYRLYKTGKNRHFILMAAFSLGAVYSHYFALAAVGLLYFVLLLYYAKVECKSVWKVIVSGSSVLVFFAPWIIFCYGTTGVVMSDYGINEVGWHDCFEFIFQSKYSMVLLYAFFVFLIIQMAYEIGMLKITKSEDKKTAVTISLSPKEWNMNGYVVWTLSGVCAVFGTIVVSKVISSLVFPIIMLRYLYPSYIIIWLLFGISISRCRLHKLYTLILIVVIFGSCYPHYFDVVKGERANNKRLESTLAATAPEIDENDFIYTNIRHFAWTVEQVYYPNTSNRSLGYAELEAIELPEMNLSMENWLFLSGPISEKMIDDLAEQECSAELIVECGFIGTGNVWVYKVVREERVAAE